MKEVKVTELRQNLPAYLARVRRGEKLRVTARGKPVADLTPPAASAAQAGAARARLRGSVVRFDRPTEPVFAPGEWEMDR